MSNEEFQRIVLEELKSLKEGQTQLVTGQRQLEERQKQLEIGQTQLVTGQKHLEKGQRQLEERQKQLETGQKQLEEGQKRLELGQEEIKKELRAVIDQTADLTEFRQEINEKIDDLVIESKEIQGILGEHEVSIRGMRRKII